MSNTDIEIVVEDPTAPEADSPAVTSVRVADVVVSLLLFALALTLGYDNWRTGAGWESTGRSPGIFRFISGSARQQPLRQAEGEAVERQVIDRAVILGGKCLARMMERVANGGFVQALDQQQGSERAVIGAHALLAGLDRGLRDVGEQNPRGDDTVEAGQFGNQRGGVPGWRGVEAQGSDDAALAGAGRGCDAAAAAGEIAEPGHDALRPWRRRVQPRQIVWSTDDAFILEFVEDEVAVHRDTQRAKDTARQEAIDADALGGM